MSANLYISKCIMLVSHRYWWHIKRYFMSQVTAIKYIREKLINGAIKIMVYEKKTVANKILNK